jgi:hypothetical protein
LLPLLLLLLLPTRFASHKSNATPLPQAATSSITDEFEAKQIHAHNDDTSA